MADEPGKPLGPFGPIRPDEIAKSTAEARQFLRADAPSWQQDFPQQAQARQDKINDLRRQIEVSWNLYQAAEGQERLEYRDIVLQQQRELDALEGTESAAREYPVEPEQSDKRAADKATPTYRELIDYYDAQGGIQGKPAREFNQETLQRIYDLEHSTEEQTADESPDETLGNFSAGIAGPSEDWLKANRAAQEERNRIAAEQAEVRHQRQVQMEQMRAQAQAERDEKRRQFERDKQAQRQQEQAAREQRNAQTEQQRQQQAALRQQQQKQSVHRQLALQTTQAAIGAINDTKVTLGNLPQPGGIGVMLIVIIFMLLAIAPMNGNGDTRLQLLWLSFWGKTSLPTSFKDKFGGSDTAGIAAAIAAGIKTGLSTTDTSATADTSADAGSSTVSSLGGALDVGNMLPFASGGF